jgi:thiosulfate dehydrogenase
MLKRLTLFNLLIAVVGAALIVAACGQAATTAAPTPAPATKPPVATATQPPATQPPATEPPTAAPQLVGDSIRGGKLYDTWWAALGVDAPTEDQPLWKTQTTNTRTGADTWRCKECHGWDYKGVEGAYGSGSHQTGFVGVMGVAGKDPNEMLAILQGTTHPDHDFSVVMDEQALADLALFLADELVDDAEVVGADKAALNGSAKAGETFWGVICAECHGPQGTAINFGDEVEPEYVGTIGADNPWEFLHKARFGQPGVEKMPSGVDINLTPQHYADLLAYVQSLPTESLVTEGGRLYDTWWAALGVDAPTEDQPLWKTQTTNTRTGADTWRCKECHGWDYKGVEGAYGSGSHQTGFKGVFGASSLSAEDLAAWLTGQKNPDHDFSAYFEEAQIKMLAAFVQQGLTEPSAYINADKTVNGDAAKGKTLYNGVCAVCHGDDGKTINFGDASEPEFVGTIAADNPVEFWHKASFGQPGEHMPAGLNLGFSLQDIADLLAYAQTLPQK